MIGGEPWCGSSSSYNLALPPGTRLGVYEIGAQNIAAIYGLEEDGGLTALVMELVDGDDLSQRIARGPIPVDEASRKP